MKAEPIHFYVCQPFDLLVSPFTFYCLITADSEHTSADDVLARKAEHWIHSRPKGSDSRTPLRW